MVRLEEILADDGDLHAVGRPPAETHVETPIARRARRIRLVEIAEIVHPSDDEASAELSRDLTMKTSGAEYRGAEYRRESGSESAIANHHAYRIPDR